MDSLLIKRSENSSFLPHVSEDDKPLAAYVLRLKIAIAIAIIRSTPKHMSPKTYAETLVHAYSSDMDALKAKCQKLEQDVFCLEQKIETVNLKEKVINLCPSIDLLEPTCQSNVLESLNVNNEANQSFKDTIDFVRSFILLDSVSSTSNRSSYENEESAPKRKIIIMKSIETLLDFIRSEDGLKMEFKIIKQAIDEVHHLFNIHFGKLNPDLVNTCLKFIDGLLLDIHKKLELNKVDEQHRRSTLIQMMSEHKSLTAAVLCRLLREVTLAADFLGALFRKGNDNFRPLLHAENVYYVLQSTEGVINIMRRQGSVLNAMKIPAAILEGWKEGVGKALADLGMHFPMFCMYVWHLDSLLKSVLADNKGEM